MNRIKYQSGYKHQLCEDYVHELPDSLKKYSYEFTSDFLSISDGKLIIRKGYAWDGPSGPAFDTKDFMRASLVHDALYQLIREGFIPRPLKSAVDDEMKRVSLEDGMSAARAWWCHRGVAKFGLSATIHNKDIKVAP